MANLDRAPCEGHKGQQDAPPEGPKSRKEQKDTAPEGPKGQKKSQRIPPPLKARSGKRDAPKAKMEAEKLK